MFIALIVLHVFISISLVLIVLLQTGRGAELGAAFGGMGQATFGRGQSTFLTKVTTALAVVFMLTSLTLAFFSAERPSGSLLEDVQSAAPAAARQTQQAEQPAEDPQTPTAQPLQQEQAPQQPTTR